MEKPGRPAAPARPDATTATSSESGPCSRSIGGSRLRSPRLGDFAGMPPRRETSEPTGGNRPQATAASSLNTPSAISRQNRHWPSRRPGDASAVFPSPLPPIPADAPSHAPLAGVLRPTLEPAREACHRGWRRGAAARGRPSTATGAGRERSVDPGVVGVQKGDLFPLVEGLPAPRGRLQSILIPSCSPTRRQAPVTVTPSSPLSTRSRTGRMARSRASSGYFLGAAMTSILRWLEASIDAGTVHSHESRPLWQHRAAAIALQSLDNDSSGSASCSGPARPRHARGDPC